MQRDADCDIIIDWLSCFPPLLLFLYLNDMSSGDLKISCS